MTSENYSADDIFIVMSSLFAIYKFSGNATGSGRHREKSIAVLPFENLGDNNENIWLGDAITEELINRSSVILTSWSVYVR